MKKLTLLSLFLILSLQACKEKQLQVSKIEGKQLHITDSIKGDTEIKNFITPYANHIESEMNAVLAYAPQDLAKTDAKYNTAIGNMEADAVMEMINPIIFKRNNDSLDGVMLNYGGIRSTINKGNITTKTAYSIMPFENEAVVVKLNYNAMQELFNYLAEKEVAHPIAGMQLILNSDGSIQKALVNSKRLDSTQTYNIATNDYLQQGGDNMNFFSKTDTVYNMNYKLRNLFIDYFKKHDTIAPVRDQRFIKLD